MRAPILKALDSRLIALSDRRECMVYFFSKFEFFYCEYFCNFFTTAKRRLINNLLGTKNPQEVSDRCDVSVIRFEMSEWTVATKSAAPAKRDADGWAVATKGTELNLRKKDKGSDATFAVGLGWDPVETKPALDLDVCMVLIDAKGRCERKEDVVFYNHPKHPTGAVVHMGDNVTGEGDGDDEVMLLNTSKLPAHVRRVAVVVSIYQGTSRKQSLAQVRSAYVRLFVPTSTHPAKELEVRTPLLQYNLSDVAGWDANATGALFCELSAESDGSWTFHANPQVFRAEYFNEYLKQRGWWPGA